MYYSCTTLINTLLVNKIPDTDTIFSKHYQKGYVKSGMAGIPYIPCHFFLNINSHLYPDDTLCQEHILNKCSQVCLSTL